MYARATTSGAAATDTELVAAPGAGKQIVVRSVKISSDTVETVDLESSTDSLRWREHLASNDGRFAECERGLFRCDDNESLTFSTGTTSSIFVSVEYMIARTTGA